MCCGLKWAEANTSSIVFARWRQCALRHSVMNCAKTAESIDLLFGLWTRVDWRKLKLNRFRQVAPMCLRGRAHWRHLVNTIEPTSAAAMWPYVKLLWPCVIIRLHHCTMFIHTACCYRPSNVVCRSACDNHEPCKNGWTDRDAVWVVDSGGLKEQCIRCGSRSLVGMGNFGDRGSPL